MYLQRALKHVSILGMASPVLAAAAYITGYTDNVSIVLHSMQFCILGVICYALSCE